MNHYVDAFVLSVPTEHLAAYKKLARKASKIWRDNGALEYRECVADDMNAPGMLPFPKMAKTKADEVVIFAYVVFESRKHRDATNQKIMNDPRAQAMCAATHGVFDSKRMAYGGFNSFVHR
jgi:uncharacterized protein YbaA (DUF1428 family)